VQEKRETLERVTAEETQLKQAFETKQAKVVNLERLKRQLAEIKETFGEMLRRLPDKTEVAALLVDISQQGWVRGWNSSCLSRGKKSHQNSTPSCRSKSAWQGATTPSDNS
jgi:Tfp pilus assembly protein PilO